MPRKKNASKSIRLQVVVSEKLGKWVKSKGNVSEYVKLLLISEALKEDVTL